MSASRTMDCQNPQILPWISGDSQRNVDIRAESYSKGGNSWQLVSLQTVIGGELHKPLRRTKVHPSARSLEVSGWYHTARILYRSWSVEAFSIIGFPSIFVLGRKNWLQLVSFISAAFRPYLLTTLYPETTLR